MMTRTLSRTVRSAALLAMLAAADGCAATPPGGAARGTVRPRETEPDLTPAPELAPIFARERARGAVVLWDSRAPKPRCFGGALCRQRFLPASTFKIPNSLIALETGVAPGPGFALRWDGVKRVIPEWNRDQTLASAFRYSVVWFYQELARRIGEGRLAMWVARLGYGNQRIDGGVDRFWLDGALRVSPLEQVTFLQRLERGALPASARAQRLVRDLMEIERGPGWVWRGKTGWAIRARNVLAGGTHPEVGWLVGWVERPDRVVYYALLVREKPADVKMWGLRRRLARAVLEQVGALPSPPAAPRGAGGG